jgi:hypothetical protein
MIYRGYRWLAALAWLALAGCVPQLPQNDVIPIDEIPTFDASAIISSKNGIIATDISRVPGTLCVPATSGLCDSSGFIPGQYLSAGSTITMAATTSTQPNFDSLLDNRYTGTANVPFLAGSGSDETYDEVKATTVATATIADGAPNSGFPGVAAIRTALQNAGLDPNVPVVYWISAANTISVSRDTYTKVNSTAQVTGTGFGANGNTYNYGGIIQESVWIGIFAHKIDLTAPNAAKPPTSRNAALPPVVTGPILNLDATGNWAKSGGPIRRR